MSKTIEFIDREISSTEIDLWYSKRLLIENPPNEELKKEMLEIKINVLERNMKSLQQIKLKLEAWEELNKTFEIGVEEQIEEIYIKGKNYYGNEKTIWGYSKDGALKVKKALEVEDESK